MKYTLLVPLLLLSFTGHIFSFEKVTYSFSKDPIDVVIPCHPKDAPAMTRIVQGVKDNVVGVRRIIIVSPSHFNDQAEWFDEALFPFNKEDVLREVCKTTGNAAKPHNKKVISWIYQQLLKLYSPLCIPGISSNVLIVDADVFFLKPVTFLQEDGAGLYAVGSEYHRPYFEHAQRVLPDLVKLYPNYSGIAHHMLLQKEVLDDFFNLVRAHHNLEPWVALCRAVALDKKGHIVFSGISEYEMYFNFVFARTDQVKIRVLRWRDVSRARDIAHCIPNYDYVALHIRTN